MCKCVSRVGEVQVRSSIVSKDPRGGMERTEQKSTAGIKSKQCCGMWAFAHNRR